MNDTPHSGGGPGADITLAAELTPFGPTRHDYARAVRAGTEYRLRRGVYIEKQRWAALSANEQYLRRLHAIMITRRSEPVFSHASAAVIHGLPLVHDDASLVHVLARGGRSGRTRNGVVEHELPHAGDVVRRSGLLVTCVARTVVDLAAGRNVLSAIAVADAAIHRRRFGSQASLTTNEELLAVWDRLFPFRGYARARRVLAVADPRAESPLESVSRVTIDQVGAPAPELQWTVSDASGPIGAVDFAWPEFGIVGEADGEAKYLDATLRGGRSAERVVIDEKHREDRIRALGFRVVRWGWREATSPALLRARLCAGGLPVRGRCRSLLST